MSKKRLLIMLSFLVLFLLISVGYCAWVISHYVDVSPVYDPLLYLAHELRDKEATYDGTAKFPTSTDVPNITYDDEFSLSYKLTGTDIFTSGCPINAGIYDFKIKCADSDDAITLQFTINKAPQVINASDLNVTYDKQPHQVNATLTTGDGTISYSPANVTNAGTTPVTITAAETENFLETTMVVNVIIAPKEVTLEWQNTTLEYIGTDQAPTAIVTNLIEGDTCTVTVSGAQTAPGTYTATATALSNSNYILPTEITHSFLIKQPLTDVDLFELKFTRTDEFMYRLGNGNTVALSSLFKLIDGVTVPDGYAALPTNVAVYDAFQSSGSTLVQLNGNAGFNCTISSSSLASTTNANVTSWLSSTTLKFTGTGIAIIELKVKNGTTDYSKVRVVVEVVDAMNATGPMSASSYNVVLLNSYETTSQISVNNHTLWGNGFSIIDKFTNTSNSTGFVYLNNGTIDNVSVIGQIYPETVVSGTTNQYYADSVISIGNSYIYNSLISGRRSAVHMQNGTLHIYDSTIDGGAYANIFADGGDAIYLDNVTLIQKPKQANIGDTSKETMGVGIYFKLPSIHLYLSGNIDQSAWATRSDISRVPSPYDTALNTMFSSGTYAKYKHNIGGTDYLNLGIVMEGSTDASSIHDNRPSDEKTTSPYEGTAISALGYNIYFYSRTNSVTATSADLTPAEFSNYKYENYKPTFTYNDSSNYIPYVNDQTSYYTYNDSTKTITYAMQAGQTFTLDWDSYISITKYGRTVMYQTYFNGAVVNGPITFDQPGTFQVKLVATPLEFYDAEGNQISQTENVEYILNVTIKVLGFAKPVINVTSTTGNFWIKGGSATDPDYGGAIPILEYLTIEYYDAGGNKVTYSGAGKTALPDGLTYTVSGFNSGNKAEQVYDGKLYVYESKLRNNPAATTLTITYTFTDPWSNSTTKAFGWAFTTSTSGSVAESTFKGTGGGGGGCVTADTLITLADGSKMMVKDLTGNELLLVWNFETGTFDSAPITFIDSDPLELNDVIILTFSDGTSVNVIYEHGFFDVDLAKYVYLDKNASSYIGHHFVNENNEVVTLVDVTIEEKLAKPYSPTTFGTFCYYVNGMLSMPGGINGMFNYFDIDTETMKYDEEQMANDIALYGELTLEDYEGLINEYAFDAFCGKWLSVSIGKGLITWEDIEYLVERYGKYFIEK